MFRIKTSQKGFSLIEVIIAVGIFSLLTLVVSSVIVSVLQANMRVRTYSLSLDNANIAMENMIRDIREGSNYHCGDDSVVPYDQPQDCEIDGDVYFAYEQAGGDPNNATDQIVIRKALVAGLRSVIQKSTDGGQTFSSAFSIENVVFDKLRFFVYGSEEIDEVSRVSIVLAGEIAPGTSNAFPFSFQSTVSERLSPAISRESQSAPVPPPYPDGGNDPDVPVAWFVSPTNNSVVQGGSEVSLIGEASDVGSGVKEVEFFDENGVSIGTDNSSPYIVKWNSLAFPNGSTYLSVVARDYAGNVSDPDSGEIRITLQNPSDNDQPTVNIIHPANSETHADTSSWDMVVYADDDTSISRNEFFVNGVSLGIQVGAPDGTYTRTVAPGTIDNTLASCDQSTDLCTHTFRTEVQDTVGKTASAQSTFYIRDTQPPTFQSFSVNPDRDIDDGDYVTISVTIRDPYGGSGISNVDIKRQRITPCSWVFPWWCSDYSVGNVQQNGNNYSATWRTPFAARDLEYKIWVEAEDRVGNLSVSNEIVIEVED